MQASGALPEDHPLYAPGLVWRPRKGGNVPMWVPPKRDAKAGYIPKSLTLDRNATPVEMAAACRRQWEDLENWRSGTVPTKVLKQSIGWLVDRYLYDPLSPFNKLKPDTQDSYRWECKRIKETVGERLLGNKIENGETKARIVGEDIRRWHHAWGHPVKKEILPDGPERVIELKPTPGRARHCIAMLRTLASYNVELGTTGAIEFRALLAAMRFDGPGTRTKAPTFAQVEAIAAQAVKAGYRSIAITTLAQFELIERRTHIIGQWHGESWGYGWVWEGEIQLGDRSERVGITPDWRIVYYQTKKGANLREFDLKVVQPLLALMQETPKDQRRGPIIICEDTGQPWTKRRYQEKFREIARAAGVPDDIYSMDMRSGGATEADDLSEVTDRMFDDAGGWTDPNMKHRYRRQKSRNAQKVVHLRQAARNKE